MQHALPSFIDMELRSANKRRHWSPSAQTYAPADVLLEYLADGWDISAVVSCEEHWYGAGRHNNIYYFELNKGERALVMPVLDNPVVCRLVHQRQLQLELIGWDDRMSFENIVSTAEPLYYIDIVSR
jgi:hypothetical protein